MKKTFKLTHPKIKTPRLVESAVSDVRKYIRRERRKELPKGVDFWDFDCKFGSTEAGAEVAHISELPKLMGKATEQALDSFYVEVLAKPGYRNKAQAKRE